MRNVRQAPRAQDDIFPFTRLMRRHEAVLPPLRIPGHKSQDRPALLVDTGPHTRLGLVLNLLEPYVFVVCLHFASVALARFRACRCAGTGIFIIIDPVGHPPPLPLFAGGLNEHRPAGILFAEFTERADPVL